MQHPSSAFGTAAHQAREGLEQRATLAGLCTAAIEETGGGEKGLPRGLVDLRRRVAIQGLRLVGRILCVLRVGHGLSFRLALRCERLERRMRSVTAMVTEKGAENFSGRSA